MKTAAVYCRISTLNHGQDVGMQLNDLRKLAEQRGYKIVNEYCDEGQSGSKSSRPALDAMLKAAKAGEFQIRLIWKLDRLGRSTSHLLRLLENFKSWEIELISFVEGLDFTTTVGKLFYTIISAFGEFERDTIRERIHGGLRNARAKGKTLGRPAITVDAARIAALRSQGRSWRKVARTLGISARTARRAGQNPPSERLSVTALNSVSA